MPTEAAPARTGKSQPKRRYLHEDISRMAGRARAEAMRRLVAQRQECRDRAVEDEPVAERFSGEQELEQKAQAAAVRRAGIQAVEAC